MTISKVGFGSQDAAVQFTQQTQSAQSSQKTIVEIVETAEGIFVKASQDGKDMALKCKDRAEAEEVKKAVEEAIAAKEQAEAASVNKPEMTEQVAAKATEPQMQEASQVDLSQSAPQPGVGEKLDIKAA